ncbi:TrmB family transcriptional regulator [Haloferax namakaokahaiae]|uniref:TrmB family transcriptional regulator n=1 Tax=Haloferax namakaokahaiae TaxID=1748331 RepID=A0ABD5ZBK1_9EURY
MRTDSNDDTRTTAIEQLEQFGLSNYAARTFVALTSLGTGTAKEVSQVSNVPRTRVYDAVEELHERGLVDIQQSSPKEFWAVSSETAGRKFEHELRYRTEVLIDALDELEPIARTEEQRGVWTVDGRQAVTERTIELLDSATDEIIYMTVEDLLTENILSALKRAAARGVSIKLAGISATVQEQIQDEIPQAEMFESLWLWSDTPAGRLMMADETKTLVSVLNGGDTAHPARSRSETAIWGAGEANSLVVVLKGIFTWRLERSEQENAADDRT